jgi:hypothetical protein
MLGGSGQIPIFKDCGYAGPMRPVTQDRFYKPPTMRGNCVIACLATIFEVPIRSIDLPDGPSHQELCDWTREHYPALREAATKNAGSASSVDEQTVSLILWPRASNGSGRRMGTGLTLLRLMRICTTGGAHFFVDRLGHVCYS